MLNITVNLETGVVKLSLASAIKAGGGVPVTVTLSANPGENLSIELALSAQSGTPAVLAYLGAFASQSQTVFTGILDANDTRLIAALAGKPALTLNCEVVLTVGDAERQVFPNFPVTVQPPILTGPATSEGGPIYLTQGVPAGLVRISSAGLEIQDSTTNVWRRISFADGSLTFTEL